MDLDEGPEMKIQKEGTVKTLSQFTFLFIALGLLTACATPAAPPVTPTVVQPAPTTASGAPRRAETRAAETLPAQAAPTIAPTVPREQRATETRAPQPTSTNGSMPTSALLSPPPVPQKGIYLGAWVNPAKGGAQAGDSGGRGFELQLPQFQTDLGGRLPGVLNFYTDFRNPPPLTIVQEIEATGSVPLISWGGRESCPDDSAISAGQYDQQIVQYANVLKNFGHPVFVRWFWEMNFTENAKACLGSAGAPGYIAAWRHIYSLFHQAGATNVAFVWCPGLAGSGGVPRMIDYYPGADYVDWIGIDGYLKDANNAASFAELFGTWYTTFVPFNKPLIVAETGAPPTEQAAYFNGMSQSVPTQFPALKAILYFDARGSNGDWQLSQAGLTAFAQLLANVYFSFHQ